MIDLDAVSVAVSASGAQDSGSGLRPASTGKRWAVPAVVALALVAVGAAFVWLRPVPEPAPPSIRFELPVTDVQMIGNPSPSPDGRWLAFRGSGADGVVRLWLRELNSVEVRPLEGTQSENPLPPSPFWSPDSRSIAFTSMRMNFAAGELKRVDIAGGPARVISAVPGGVKGSWNQDDAIVFAANGVPGTLGLLRVPATGGQPVRVTAIDGDRGETAHDHPQFLPDGRRFLYFAVSEDPAVQGVYVGSLDLAPVEQSKEPLLSTNRNVRYVPSSAGGPGWLLSVREATLFAQRFDPDRLAFTGSPIPVADQVGSFPGANAAFYDASDTGVLAYALESYSERLLVLDRQGEVVETVLEGSNANPALSPDETRVAYSQLDPQSGDSSIWVLDLQTRNRTKITFRRGRSDFPVWSPDGGQLAYASNESGRFNLYRKNADGSGEEALLVASESDKLPTSWSSNGFLLYQISSPGGNTDVWLLPLARGGDPRPYLATESPEYQAHFSPDGAWVAYGARESTPEVYVRRFSADQDAASTSNEKWLISDDSDGGFDPRWNGDGTELYYLDPTLGQRQVDIRAADAVSKSPSIRLFAVNALSGSWSVTRDGQRFLHTGASTPSASARVIVVTNWLADLGE